MSEEYVGGYPGLQICGAFGSITIRGDVPTVERILRDMRESKSAVVATAYAAVQKNVNDLASGDIGGAGKTEASKPTGSAYKGGGGSKWPEKRKHPEELKCSHGEVVVEQHNSTSGEGYWVCGKFKTYGGSKDCSFKDDKNIKDESKIRS